MNPQKFPAGNPDSFLTSHLGGYDNGIQTQGQFMTFKKKTYLTIGFLLLA